MTISSAYSLIYFGPSMSISCAPLYAISSSAANKRTISANYFEGNL